MCRYIFTRLRSCARWLCAYCAKRSSVVGGNFGRRVVVLNTLVLFFAPVYRHYGVLSHVFAVYIVHICKAKYSKNIRKSQYLSFFLAFPTQSAG